MSNSPMQAPGEKMKKAIQQFSEWLEEKPDKTRNQLLQDAAIKYDLSPLECDFLARHFKE